jgi:DNA-directed RNA polymerase specialized sigma24 family protein
MSTRELLENYRMTVIEIDTLERQSRFLNQYIGGPTPVRSARITGMPRGTNDSVSALLQRADDDDAIHKLERRCAELREMVDEFERVMDSIHDKRLQIIIRDYYALGWSEEEIADYMELSRQHVNRLRLGFLRELVVYENSCA